MSVKNVYNCDAYPWPKNTILMAGHSMINGINQKHFSVNFKSVKVRCFNNATIYDTHFNFIPLLTKKPAALVLNVGTNNTPIETSFQIYNKVLNLVLFTIEDNPDCHFVLSSPIQILEEQLSLLIN